MIPSLDLPPGPPRRHAAPPRAANPFPHIPAATLHRRVVAGPAEKCLTGKRRLQIRGSHGTARAHAIREKQEDNGAKDERMNRMDEVVAEATEAIVNNESNNPLLNALDLMKENVGAKEYVVDNVHLIQSAAKRPGASGKILTPLKKQRKW